MCLKFTRFSHCLNVNVEGEKEIVTRDLYAWWRWHPTRELSLNSNRNEFIHIFDLNVVLFSK